MGQAKRRGTFEERRRQSIERNIPVRNPPKEGQVISVGVRHGPPSRSVVLALAAMSMGLSIPPTKRSTDDF